MGKPKCFGNYNLWPQHFNRGCGGCEYLLVCISLSNKGKRKDCFADYKYSEKLSDRNCFQCIDYGECFVATKNIFCYPKDDFKPKNIPNTEICKDGCAHFDGNYFKRPCWGCKYGLGSSYLYETESNMFAIQSDMIDKENTQQSDGSTASYYELPEGATELQDIISFLNCNSQMGEIGRAWMRYGRCPHSPKTRDIKKIIFYAQAELERLEKYEKD